MNLDYNLVKNEVDIFYRDFGIRGKPKFDIGVHYNEQRHVRSKRKAKRYNLKVQHFYTYVLSHLFPCMLISNTRFEVANVSNFYPYGNLTIHIHIKLPSNSV